MSKRKYIEGLVSIIMPSYNSSRYISDSIKSILSQTYSNWELLITDDNSSDETVSIIESFSKSDSRIKLFALAKNRGAGYARNYSLSKSSGQYIAFCDSDDLWLSHKLCDQIDFMVKHKVHLVYSNYYTCDSDNKIQGFVKAKKRISRNDLLVDCGIGCLTGIYDASSFGISFLPEIRKRQDWAMWIDVISKTKKAYLVNDYLAIYRKASGSISSNKLKLLPYNFAVYNKVLNYSFFKSMIFLFFLFLPIYFYKLIKGKFLNLYTHNPYRGKNYELLLNQ